MKNQARNDVKFRDFLAEELQDEQVRRYYEEAKAASQAARAVTAARRRAGLTQVELARRIGTDQKGIWRLEAGRQNATVETLEKVAKATGSLLSINISSLRRRRRVAGDGPRRRKRA